MNGNDIECAFIGRLGADPKSRTAKSGKTYARLNVAVGEGETSQWVQVTVFADAAEKVLALREGDKVYIEGRIKRQAVALLALAVGPRVERWQPSGRTGSGRSGSVGAKPPSEGQSKPANSATAPAPAATPASYEREDKIPF